MYVHINEDYLNKNKTKAKKEAIELLGEKDAKESLLFPALNGEVEIEQFMDGKLLCSIDTDLAYLFFEVNIDDALAFRIIEYMKEKGREIKRLINLAD